MRRLRNILFLTLAAAAAGCFVEGGYVREEPSYYATGPQPPAPTADVDETYQSEAPIPAGANVPDQDIFYDSLSPYGSWTDVAPYGRVWVPTVGYGWRPYYYGRWVLTDWGWTFVSDDPWGWAAYHYGRWNWGIGIGWYWIPGTVWGPAWVSWRYGGGYVSWCPLGPRGVVFGYRHPAWVAVSQVHFTQPIARSAVPIRQTAGIVQAAQPLGGPHATVARNGSFGPPVAGIAEATGRTLRPVAAATVVGRPHAAAPRAMAPGAGAPVARPGAGVMRSPAPRPRPGVMGRPPAARPSPGPAPAAKGGGHGGHSGSGKSK